ncbi:hypothetical protein [Methanobacterium petrolearium]|uniref:hypothetical protein n=1 Tax=Methanobacterium petrolearium TaxID=710190 RepID=UPI001AE40297|nr:hypothetical protein [Methanobacterium petrolearium]MBP1947009.1 hypothetical protein [Methanobacterium petrolearium]BDZ70428.1 hypothetical protein GCM10025861_09450 [Methanobacterium petrolearium]
MKNNLVLCMLILVIMAFSGCTDRNPNPGNVIYDLNIESTLDNPVVDKYIMITDVDYVIIEYTDITPINGISCDFQFVTYDVPTQTGQSSTNYESNIIDVKRISTDSAPISGSVTLNAKGAKSIGIRDSNGKGRVKLIMNESRSFDPFYFFT